MTRVLLAVDSVHGAAVACDYLGDRLGSGDAVVAVGVAEPGAARDVADALNVVSVRLAAPVVETATREGEAAPEILAAADDRDVDEIALVAGANGAGATARSVVADAARPVVVIPA